MAWPKESLDIFDQSTWAQTAPAPRQHRASTAPPTAFAAFAALAALATLAALVALVAMAALAALAALRTLPALPALAAPLLASATTTDLIEKCAAEN